MLAGMDDAVSDGVDVLSLSLGYNNVPPNYYKSDPISVGGLHATLKEVVVVASAGNSGPKVSSVSNVAPWILTVGANTVDRTFPATVILGDGTLLQVNAPSL